MATAFLSHIFSATTHIQPVTAENCESIIRNGLPKSAFLFDFAASTALCSSSLQGKAAVSRKFKICAHKSSLDHIPKQFRQENLKDGVMENFNNVPQYLYGLSPEQMEMFMTEDNPVNRQSMNVTEESISSARSYLDIAGMSRYSMRTSMSRGRARGRGRPSDPSSMILDRRIVYLGRPILPEVAQLIIAEFMWLDYDNSSKPIFLFINSRGTQNEMMETIGSHADAFAIADCMAYCKSKVYTVNLTTAYGYAAMLFSLGEKGHRLVLPEAFTKLYLPKLYKSSGQASDMWIKAKELEANTDIFIELLSEGIGKPKEEIARDLQRPKFMLAQAAVDYGIADRIIYSMDNIYEKCNYDEMPAQSKAIRKGGARVGGAPSRYL